jgi:hypothetical protein
VRTAIPWLITYVVGVGILWPIMVYSSPRKSTRLGTHFTTALLWPLFILLGVVGILKLVFWGRA